MPAYEQQKAVTRYPQLIKQAFNKITRKLRGHSMIESKRLALRNLYLMKLRLLDQGRRKKDFQWRRIKYIQCAILWFPKKNTTIRFRCSK